MQTAPIVNCPNCGKSVAWNGLSCWRPFCSERCKSLDLGAWASEHYRVPVEQAPQLSED